MKRRFWRGLTAATLFAALPAAAVFVSQVNRAASADEETGGRVVQISPNEDSKPIKVKEEEVQEAEAPSYWIGAQVMPVLDPALRTHLQLADEVGLLVGHVVPDGPAAKAGLQEHDVIIAVNGETLNDREQLLSFLDKNQDKPFELKVIRLAKEIKVKVTPEKRPADAGANAPEGAQGPAAQLEQLFGQGGVPGGAFRLFGNGMVPQGFGFDVNQAPSGVSVSITRENDQPAKITVKKGDKTWTVQGDDEKALKELPDDVRPFVEQLLQGSRGGRLGANLGRDWQNLIPNDLGQFGDGLDNGALRQRAQQMRQRTDQATHRLQRQMEEMKKQLERLQQQFEENSPNDRTNPTDDPSKT
jgi:membrane-associated protease RseP (regulator of RpoE activity)